MSGILRERKQRIICEERILERETNRMYMTSEVKFRINENSKVSNFV